MSNFGRGLAKKHLCEIISKSVYRFSRGSCLKLFSIYSPGAILFTRAERFEQFWRIVTKETFKYIYFFKIDVLVKEEKSIEGFSIFSSGGHRVQWSGTV